MIFKLVLCSLLAFACGAPAQAPRKCIPEQYEGVAFGKVAQVADRMPMALSLSACLASDYINQKEAFHEAVQFNNMTVKISIVADYKKKMMFYVEHDSKKCTPIKIDMPQERFCSDMSKPTDSFIMGDKMVDMYDIERTYLGKTARSTVTMFRDNFTPATEIIEQEFAGIPQMVALQFGNITLGIKDESIFDVPSYC